MDNTANWITTALTSLWDIVSSCFDFMIGNAYFGILLVIGLVCAAFKVIRKAKRTAIK